MRSTEPTLFRQSHSFNPPPAIAVFLCFHPCHRPGPRKPLSRKQERPWLLV
jgi:hypothetical protein